jgi:single-stranded-DNA-specific exonuclease
LRALLKRLGGRTARAADVGFKIGPRINAAGRLASANTAIDLFAATDEDAAWKICSELDRMNAERQEIELQVRESAEAQIRGGERILILAGEEWHRGVLGLTAGRIAQRYHRPTLVMTIEEGETCIGSGRSISTIDLHRALESVSDVFTHFGGHEFACGFSLESRNLDALRARLHQLFETFDESLFHREARIDTTLTLGEIDAESSPRTNCSSPSARVTRSLCSSFATSPSPERARSPRTVSSCRCPMRQRRRLACSGQA